MVTDSPLADHKAKASAGACPLCGIEGLEDAGPRCLINSGAIVRDFEAGLAFAPVDADIDLSVVADGITRIEDEVEEGLDKLAAVCPHGRLDACALEAKLDIYGNTGPSEGECLFDALHKIFDSERDVSGAGEVKEPAGEFGSSPGRRLDTLDGVARFVIEFAHTEETDVAEDG